MIIVNLDDTAVKQALHNLQQSGRHLRPVFLDIGEHLTNTTQERFRTSTAPDGSRWEANAQSTYLALLGKKDERKKDGKINQRGINKIVSKKPLIGELGWSGGLADQIHYQADDASVTVGSNKPYAAMQQFGGTKSQFPWLWGDIAAREFLGLSDDDRSEILTLVLDHLAS